jgi:hypothetical protein
MQPLTVILNAVITNDGKQNNMQRKMEQSIWIGVPFRRIFQTAGFLVSFKLLKKLALSL